MATTECRSAVPTREMDWVEHSRRKLGYQELLQARTDWRLLIARTRKGEWFFLASHIDIHKWGDKPDLTVDPFSSRDEAEVAARHWFIQNPSGTLAELLAKEPYDP